MIIEENLPKNWRIIQIKDSCELVMGQSPPGSSYNIEGEGMPFLQGKAEFGNLFPNYLKYSNKPLKKAKKGDILISVRAPVGDVNIANIDYCIGRGLASINLVNGDNKYLYYLLNYLKPKIKHLGTGSTFKAITKSTLETIEIPVPPVEIQRKIVDILENVEKLKEWRTEADKLTDEYSKSVYLKMFGNPIVNSMNWEIYKFGSIGKLERGKSKNRPRNAKELLGGPYPLIQTGDVSNCDGYINAYNQTYSRLGLEQSRMWKSGTLCITIAANIAKTGILTFDACFPDSVVGFTPGKKIKSDYVRYWMSFLQKILEENAPESAQKNINLKILSNLDIPVPPIELQNQFAELVQTIETLKAHQKESKILIDNLFNNLMQRAFKGELVC